MNEALDYLVEHERARRASADVRLGGIAQQLPNVAGAITLRQAFGQAISGGAVQLRNPNPQPRIGMPIAIRLGYGPELVQVFAGYVTNIERSSYPGTWTVQVQDVLWRADFPWKTEQINLMNHKRAQWVIATLLEQYGGVGRTNIPQLEIRPSVPWVLGKLTPILFQNMTPLQAALQVCSPLGYWLYADGTGTVQAVRMSGAPGPLVFRTFRRGVDLLVRGAPTRSTDAASIYNRVVVSGANTGPQGTQIKDRFEVPHPLLPAGVFRELSYANSLIETLTEASGGGASCEAIARRMLYEHTRDPDVLRATIMGDPRLHVGMTIAVEDAAVGHASAKNYFLYSVETSFGAGHYTQSLVLDGGVGLPQAENIVPPPSAAFTWITTRGSVATLALDGTPSGGIDGARIVAYSWRDQGGRTATVAKPTWTYPLAQRYTTVYLTVTDERGKTGSTHRTIDLFDTGPGGGGGDNWGGGAPGWDDGSSWGPGSGAEPWLHSDLGPHLKCWSLGVGSTPPAGWTQVAYAATGWTEALDALDWIDGVAYPADSLPGTTPVTEKNDPVPANYGWLLRHRFDLPWSVSDVDLSYLTVRAEDFLDAVYVNGTLLGSATGNLATEGLGYNQETFEVSPSLFVKGGTNVLAFEVRNAPDGGNNTWVSYELGLSGVAAEPPPTTSPATTILASTSAKALNSASPPANWFALSFDDSAWPQAISGPTYGGIVSILASGSRAETTRHAIRQRFTLPAGTITNATLTVHAEDQAVDIYVNGARIGGTAAGGVGKIASATFSVREQLLPGTENVIAALVKNDSAVEMGFAFKLEINT